MLIISQQTWKDKKTSVFMEKSIEDTMTYYTNINENEE